MFVSNIKKIKWLFIQRTLGKEIEALLGQYQQISPWQSSVCCVERGITFVWNVWRRLHQFTWRPSYNAVLGCSSTLLRQVGCQYDKITENVFMFHYLLSPYNFYLSVPINAPNFNSKGSWNNISSCDQFEIKWSHYQRNHPAHQSDLVT